jgi:uncharacterized protein (TIGR03437 family)
LNMVQGVELHFPTGIALDARGGQMHLYIADTINSRVMAWQDITNYQDGNPPSLILGQSNPQSTGAYGIGAQGFNFCAQRAQGAVCADPAGLAVDPNSGDLFVADFGNNRVLRFASPFNNPGQVQPNAVYGQPNYTTFTAAAVSAFAMNQPTGVAVDSSSNLWVADSGNNRILRFSAGILNNTAPVAADFVAGQPNFGGGQANQGGQVSANGLSAPAGIAFDAQNNLYVADSGNNRVVKFAAPGSSGANPAAVGVWGQSNFTTNTYPSPATSSTMGGPAGVAVDASGNVYVSTPNDNRVLVFPATGTAATNVLGQGNFTSTAANSGTAPAASSKTLSAPSDVKVDASGNVFIADTLNNRVILMPAGSTSASQVWGQNGFLNNGPNEVKPSSINSPYQIAIDYSNSQGPYPVYVSDTGNNRVLVWKDSVGFKSGDPADLVIGQPGLYTAYANGGTQTASAMWLSSPKGIAVDPNSGNLFVADSGNNRVLRFPRPVAQQGQITPDAVIGQLSFTSSGSLPVTSNSLNAPGGVAIGPNGDLFVADTGDNRVLEFPPGAGTGTAAIRVYGQPGMNSSAAPGQPSVQTLSAPQGIFVDPGTNLYVADTGSNRVVIFSDTQNNAPPSGDAADYVIGQGDFQGDPGGTPLKSPVGIGVDSSHQIYVSDYGNNRIVVFPVLLLLPSSGATATYAVGQPNLTGSSPNWDGQAGAASADSLWFPAGVYLDRQDTLYVGDTGNNRVLHFLKLGAVVNAATSRQGFPVAPGSIGTILAGALCPSVSSACLASSTGQATQSAWNTSIADREVLINDQLAAPLYFVGPNQINFQVPSNANPGPGNRIAVRLADTGELVAGGSIAVAATAPGLFSSAYNGMSQVVLNQDNSVNGSTNPAAAGSVVQVFGTGQGQVSPTVPDGTAAASSPMSNTVAVPTANATTCENSQPSICVLIGNALGNIQYSGLAPGYVGLWQINVVVPTGLGAGNVGLSVIIDGVPSNQITVAVH